MHRLILQVLLVGGATLLLLFGIGAGTYWVIGVINRQAVLFETDTLQKLRYAAEINSNQAEGYARILLALSARTPELRHKYVADVEQFMRRNDAILRDYKMTVMSDHLENVVEFDRLVEQRKQYLEVRRQVLDLLSRDQLEAAQALAADTLWPIYERYTAAGDELFAHDVQVGKQRSQEIRKLGERVRLSAACLCVVVFVIGLATPFFCFAFFAHSLEKQ